MGWLKAIALVVVVWLVFKLIGAACAPEEPSAPLAHLVNRLWIERLPVHERDLIAHFMLVDRDRVRVGAVGRSSAWRMNIDLAMWTLEGNKLAMQFPQSEKTTQFSVRTWECNEGPDGFDLCLELAHPKAHPMRFYSSKKWEIGGANAALPESAGPAARAIVDQLAATGASELGRQVKFVPGVPPAWSEILSNPSP